MDTSGIEPDPSRKSDQMMLSERDKPTTPCTRYRQIKVQMIYTACRSQGLMTD